VKEGKPYVMFGDGTLAACKPISEQDLARFIADCIVQVGRWGTGWRQGGAGGCL
jgi:divinyl chlorophyllide a 8-vinyl-reductase